MGHYLKLLHERTKANSTDFALKKALPSITVMILTFAIVNWQNVKNAVTVGVRHVLLDFSFFDVIWRVILTLLVYLALRWGDYLRKLPTMAEAIYKDQDEQIKTLQAKIAIKSSDDIHDEDLCAFVDNELTGAPHGDLQQLKQVLYSGPIRKNKLGDPFINKYRNCGLLQLSKPDDGGYWLCSVPESRRTALSSALSKRGV